MAEAPRLALWDDGVAEIVKSGTGAGVTVTPTVVVWTVVPAVAVMVTVYEPAVTALSPSVAEADPGELRLNDVGDTEGVRPLTGPEVTLAESPTVPVSPLRLVTVIVLAFALLVPAVKLADDGLAPTEKSGVGGGGAGAENAAVLLGVPRPVGPS